MVALLGALWLYALADSGAEYVSAAIYSTGLLLLFAVSGTYHSLSWGAAAAGLLRRVDHSLIFVLIAATYTPFCLLVLEGVSGITLLMLVWSLAICGVLLKLTWIESPRWLGVLLYLGLGWLAVAAAPFVATSVTLSTTVLLLVGGLLYTLGALVYALRRPDPFPAVFGYHEVFHLFVIAGAATHYALVAALFVDGSIG